MRGPGHIATAYDALAAAYDGHLTGDEWIRRILWRHFERVFGPGDRVLDVGCGTGLDTIHLVSRRIRVTAVDISPKMIGEMHSKLERAPFGHLVDSHVGNFIDIAAGLEGPYDGAISSFAALNTIDLDAFSRAAARLVRPGGRIVCHLLSPGYFSRFFFPFLGRGRARSTVAPAAGVRRIDVGGQLLDHVNLPAPEVYRRFFREDFLLREAYACGLLARRIATHKIPARWLDLLGRADRLLGALPGLVSAGGFFVLDLERRAR